MTDHLSLIDPDRERKVMERIVQHPLEQVFNLPPNSTTVESFVPRETELVLADGYDDKDVEIEANFQEVFDKAMDVFDEMQESMLATESITHAAKQETASMMLTTALNAAKEKARMKEHKDKLRSKAISGGATIEGGTTNTQNNIFLSTSELIKMMASEKSPINNMSKDAVVIEAEQTPQPEEPIRKIPRRKKTDE